MKNYNYCLKLLRIRKESDDCYITLSPFAKIIELNYSGYLILEEARKTNNIDKLIKLIGEKYKLNKDEIAQDVIEFMDQMQLCGIVEVINLEVTK